MDEIKIEVPLPDYVREIVKETLNQYMTNGKRLETCPLYRRAKLFKAKIIGIGIGLVIASGGMGALSFELIRKFLKLG